MFQKSHETEMLLQLFKSLPIDKPVSFAAASKAVGFPVKSTLAAYHSARRIAEREMSVVIDGIRGFGFRRLTGEKMSESGERDLRAIRRRSRRGAFRQEIAILQNLDAAHMLRSTELLARFRITADAASPVRSNRRMVVPPDPENPIDARERLRAVMARTD